MGELIATLDNYSIYKVYVNEQDNYYLCVPNGNINKCQIYLGFSDRDFDMMSKDEIISMITEVNDMIYKLNNSSIYALPNIPIVELNQAAIENDDRMYNQLLSNKIQPITSNIYNMLVNKKINPNNISQVIHVVKKNETDRKITAWLSIKLGDRYIKEVDYDILREEITKLEVDSSLKTGVSIPISDIPLEQIQDNQPVFDSGIAPVNHEYDNASSINKGNRLVKRKQKQIEVSPGFSSIKFIIATLLFSLVIGVSIGYLIMK